MINVLGTVSGDGRSRDALVFVAGRDDPPPGPGANDNGSGTGALVELARTLVGSVTQTSLVFASVDGTTAESAGARELARHPPGGLSCARASRCARSAASTAGWCCGSRARAADCRRRAGCARSSRRCATRTSTTRGCPRSVSRSPGSWHPSCTAIRRRWSASEPTSIGIDGSRPGESSAADMPDHLSADRLGRVGTAAQLAALAFDTGPRPASLGTTYLVSSDRVLRGWTIELFLVALLIPPAFALIDAATRARARGARPSITVRRVLWRAAGMALGVLVIRIEGAAGILPDTHSPPFAGSGGGVSLWQVVFPLALGGAVGALAARRVPGDADTAGAGRYLGAHSALLRRRRPRVRGQCLSARARAPRPAHLAPAPAHRAPGRRGTSGGGARGLARACSRHRAARGGGRLRRRRARLVRPPDGRRRNPARLQPCAGRPGLGDGGAAVARGHGRRAAPVRGMARPRNRVRLVADAHSRPPPRNHPRRLRRPPRHLRRHGRVLARSGDEHLHRLRAARDERTAARHLRFLAGDGEARARRLARAGRHARRRHGERRQQRGRPALGEAPRAQVRGRREGPHRPAARAHPDQADRALDDRRREHRLLGQPEQGPGPLRAGLLPGPRPDDRHRRAPHDVRGAVPAHRQHPRSATRSSSRCRTAPSPTA